MVLESDEHTTAPVPLHCVVRVMIMVLESDGYGVREQCS
jgi:hypothetical protein